ncbi:MAG: DEAD/DEAH box helicase [Fusobacterium sp.]|uniref:DEAD/DEAH box helicase n=1 Tax=Fusobacterium sp. TaxID=68766 RepID=UPI002A759734|nr:DEAD/DEAH box helicase [Fusobacterium sp.]MDY2981716.1 DEAD/DEAH box helicase [Fusobacterium sp.]
MEENLVLDVLNAWRFIETVSLKDTKGKRTLKYYEEEYNKKTEEEKNKLKNIKYNYIVYLGIFCEGRFLKYFRELKSTEKDVINFSESPKFSISITLDNEKKIKQDTIFIPDSTALLYNRMEIENIEITKREIKALLKDEMELYKDKIITDETLKELNGKIKKILLEKICSSEKNKFFEEGYSVYKIKEEDIDNNFNSFYINDLDEIIKNGYNDKLVKLFIQGYNKDERVIIDENREEISKTAAPKNISVGKWPSPIKFQLSLMQSVAVDTIVNKMVKEDELKISSVNGPPGTGKTTLLKDIFANIIIERAKAMINLEKPEYLFRGYFGKKEINGETLYFNRLNKSIKGFEIVVASSNNGAVENISKELPQLKQISRKDNKDFNEIENGYEKLYREKIEELDLYREISKEIIGGEAWGIFSVALGRGNNINKFFDIIFDKSDDLFSCMRDYNQNCVEKWSDLKEEFNKKLLEIEKIKEELQQIAEYFEDLKEVEEKEKNIIKRVETKEKEILSKKKDIVEINNKLLESKEPGILSKILSSKKYREYNKLKEKKENLIREEEFLNREIRNVEKELESIKIEKVRLEEKLNKYGNIVKSDDNYWQKENYENRQQKTPWLVDKLEGLRGELFILALKIHKYICAKNSDKLKNQFLLIKNRKALNTDISDEKRALIEAWQSVHLIFPVISTTFASFSSMYRGLYEKMIGYLVIDEAGQASPQQAMGGIYRSKHVICVGDPLQIEPVVTIDKVLLSDIAKKYNIKNEEIYFGESASVQGLADLANKYGCYKDAENKKWIGIPLWVHRRCLDPMFSMANEMAYNNKMVLADKKTGKSEWISVKGNVKGKQYVEEQGQKLLERIKEHWKNLEKESPSVYIITPFTEVKSEIKKLLKKELLKDEEIKEVLKRKINKEDEKEIRNIIESWIEVSIGTVHTFQGKEANIVYFVCGGDESTEGAINWSCSKPNLLNVAVTRAKKEFYIIGDKDLISPKQYYNIIAQKIKTDLN